MINPLHLQLAKTLLGRDYTPEATAFTKAMYELAQGLTKEQQLFISQHWMNVHEFLASPQGKEAAQLFVTEWQAQKGVPKDAS